MKKVMMYLLACSTMLLSNVTFAESPHEFSANVAFTTNYMYRGVTQTSSQPAVSGGFDYAHESGIYLGTWASSLEFGSGDNDTTIEIDYYGGIAGDFSNGVSWDIGGLYYQYPGTDADTAGDFDFFEIYGSLGYTFENVSFQPSIGTYMAYSPDFFGETGDAFYFTGELGLSLPYDVGLSFLYGNQSIDQSTDYSHFVVGLNKDWSIFNFDISYYEGIDDCSDQSCDAAVFTVSSSW
jgi:uncharacterized protein (TIGR02001 family)